MLKRFKPKSYELSVGDIDYNGLYDGGTRFLVFDLDNTIAPYDVSEPDRGIVDFFEQLKEIGFKICFLSNNKPERVEKFNKSLGLHYVAKANKPGKKGITKALQLMGADGVKNAVLIGDQFFTDIWCGNRVGMHTILVKSVSQRDEFTVRLKRVPEKLFFGRYVKKQIELKTTTNGNTAVLGVIGYPVAHTLSPQIHKEIAKKASRNTVYVPFLSKPEKLGSAIEGAFALGIKGLNITVPHKIEVMKYLSDIDSTAEKIGAVNTCVHTKDGYKGFNTDITGIIETFKARNYSPNGKTAVLLGAGGSAYAAAFALAEMGAKKIIILNRTLISAETLANRVKLYYNKLDICAAQNNEDSVLLYIPTADVLIQTTVVGFSGLKNESPVPMNDLSLYKNTEFALDLIYKPWETVFLKNIANAPKKPICVNGFDMLVYQAIAAYEIFMGDRFSVFSNQDEKTAFIGSIAKKYLQ